MKSLNPLEKDIERNICERAKALKILCYKFTSPSRCSVPDRLFVVPGGRVFFMELKRKGQKPSPAQAVEIARLRQQGATVYVVDNVAEGKKILEAESDPVNNY